MTSSDYCAAVKQCLLPYIGRNQHLAYLQDNAPIHKSKETMGWLAEHGVAVVDFPPYSPDINPIEHVWEIIKRKVSDRTPRTHQQLAHYFLEEYENFDMNLFRRLVDSIPGRLKMVIEKNGEMTDY